MKLTIETIGQINLFEKLTGARVRDMWQDSNVLVFLIEQGNIQRALGKNGENLKRAENVFKKKIRLVLFSDDVCKFVNNLIYPNHADDIKLVDSNVIIYAKDAKIKGKIFGRDRENLKKLNEIVKRYFSSVNDIKIQWFYWTGKYINK